MRYRPLWELWISGYQWHDMGAWAGKGEGYVFLHQMVAVLGGETHVLKQEALFI